MAEVLVELMKSVVDADTGEAYGVLACGEPTPEGTWHGWLEFVSTSGARLRSPRETTQPNRLDTIYWATGLTPIYLEGAFDRAKIFERATDGAVGTRAASARRRTSAAAVTSDAAGLATEPRTEGVLPEVERGRR